ncbi:acyl-CoA dehydrogenase family protein [Geodermatophilus marinus]|uniref:acyl-CoA dehydrogenase family protein n=1 Tax=Geodermatophilus sp. LHW52908 TaxID=2303986 RepID=UPI000E3E4ADC|nr:acyl-CoA dehydrogenase family protein [Geodermatophilus sp. LHW52908]RFU21501.1 acyl-CoA dehydrogenase [Geodermatophilus sp. LHW52908]
MVEFEFTPEQRDLRAVAREFCTERFAGPEVRRLVETPDGFDREVWRRLGRDVGLLGLALPEELGGAGAGLVDLALVAEEFGRAVAPAPLVGTVALAATALRLAGDDGTAEELLPAIAEGEAVVALAATDDRGAWAPAQPTVRATRTDSGWRLTGEQAHVLDGAAADAVLVLATTETGTGLFAVDGAADGLTREPLSVLDLTRRLARLRYADVPARAVGEPGQAATAVAGARDVAAVVLAAEAVGGAQRLLDMSVEYARTRLQFGRAIGSFQAVKHRCADMLVDVEHARSVAYHAAWAQDAGTDDPRVAADLATTVTAEAYLRVAKNTVQVHGGIGFTWEHPTHLYYKRAVGDAALLGGRAAAAERLAAAVLDGPALGGVA